MKTRFSGIALSLLLAMFALACGGSSVAPPPDDSNFERLTAQVFANDGSPVPGLEVRVEGVQTGVITNANGEFVLEEDDFPNGVDSSNEIALGENGVVVATKTIVPEQSPEITIQFGDSGTPPAGGTASISGKVADENSKAPLAEVEVTLFSLESGIYQDTTDAGGEFSIENVAAGDWQLVAFKAGYYPEMAFLSLEEGQALTYDVLMGAEGAVPPGEGIKVRGMLTDAQTGAPIAGALLSMTADTGYYGIPEPALYEDMTGMMGKPDASGQTEPGRDSSMAMPFYYDPQYQETTSAADGSFEFPNSVVGYAVYLNFNADGYFGGTWYESIDGRSEDLELDLTLEPIVETSIHGLVKDGEGNPIDGAYVEFIYAGGFGGPMPMTDIALPPVMDLDGMTADGQATRDNVGAPPPPPLPPMEPGMAGGDGRGWEDATEGDFAGPNSGGAPGAPGSSGSEFDNQFMQKFRFDHQNGRGTSSAEPFSGYLSTVTNPDGSFDFEDVPAGPYYVFVSAYRHIPHSGEFEASENAAENNPEFVLPEVPVGAVEGTVVDADTLEPLEEVLVNATQPNVDPFTYTDATGHFFIDNIPVGQWIVSAFKSGYLTVSQEVEITDGGVVTVNLAVVPFEAPEVELLAFSGKVYDGSKGYSGGDSELVGIASPTLVFTPVAPELGGYYRHVTGDSDGDFTVDLANQTDYNLLIQATDFQDLYTRIWADATWPKMDFGLMPVKGAPGGGGGGGVIVGPPVPGEDPSTGGGSMPGGGPDGRPDGDPIPL